MRSWSRALIGFAVDVGHAFLVRRRAACARGSRRGAGDIRARRYHRTRAPLSLADSI
jgi:hypothetical protein